MALTPPAFEERDRRELLRIARASIREHFLTGMLPPGTPHRQPLLEPCGAAVQIHRADGLAGQALELAPTDPIFLTIEKLAVEATQRAEIAPDEIPSIKISIALLSPIEATSAPSSSLIPGLHGVVVTRGPRRGICLPDATRDATALLDDACAHAAMQPGAWRDERVQVALFAALTFTEG